MVSVKETSLIVGVTLELVTEFTQKQKSVKAADVFKAIKRYIKKAFLFKDESVYDILTVWSMGLMFSQFSGIILHTSASRNDIWQIQF